MASVNKKLGVLRASRSAKQKKPESLRVQTFTGCGVQNCKVCGFFTGVRIGKYWGYTAYVTKTPTGRATLRIGCRRFRTPAPPASHWATGYHRNGEDRGDAPALIARAAAIAKKKRWQWGKPSSRRTETGE